MTQRIQKLLLTFSLAFLLTPMIASANGPTVDHRFYIELPDGSREEIKGAKIHKYYEGRTDLGELSEIVASYCRYPGFGETLERDISDAYHCATNESCFLNDYGAAYLPKNFNADSRIYTQADASYLSFNERTFVDFLQEKVPYLANMYDSNNIRGFSGARWQATVDYSAESGASAITIPSDLSGAAFTGNDDWGLIKDADGSTMFAEKQSWQPGEVYHNPVGGNVLQGRITWVLKPPSEPPPPICVSARLQNTDGETISDLSSIKIGDQVQVVCGQVEGVSEYAFRIGKFGAVGEPATFTELQAAEGNISEVFTIESAGGYVAQCAICPNGNCQEFGDHTQP